jgi:hypothetical protein
MSFFSGGGDLASAAQDMINPAGANSDDYRSDKSSGTMAWRKMYDPLNLYDNILRKKGSSESTTTDTPSPWDIEKSQTLQQLQKLLIPIIAPEMSGQMTAHKQHVINLQDRANTAAAAKMGMAKGDPRMLNSMRYTSTPDLDMAKIAAQMYGFQPQSSVSQATTASTTPSGADEMATLIRLASMAKAMGSGWGGDGGGYLSNASTGSGDLNAGMA